MIIAKLYKCKVIVISGGGGDDCSFTLALRSHSARHSVLKVKNAACPKDQII